MHTSANRDTYTHNNFDSKRIQRSLYLLDYCERNLKKKYSCFFFPESSVTGEPPAKRRVDVSGELATRRDQIDKENSLRGRKMALKEQKLKLDQQKFEAGEEERKELLKFAAAARSWSLARDSNSSCRLCSLKSTRSLFYRSYTYESMVLVMMLMSALPRPK